MELKHFEVLNTINVNDKTEVKKAGNTELTYLSWSFAWAEVKKQYPNATYKILKFENNLPYVFDKLTGYMVFTEMTIEGITHEMWLPVMDGANKAMKNSDYTYKVQKKEWSNSYKKYINLKDKDGNVLYDSKTVESATMFDINKTIMRCLVKNIAMFGLGLYIYAGEDLPEGSVEEEKEELTTKILNKFPDASVKHKTQEDIEKDKILDELLTYGYTKQIIEKKKDIFTVYQLSIEELDKILNIVKEAKNKKEN